MKNVPTKVLGIIIGLLISIPAIDIVFSPELYVPHYSLHNFEFIKNMNVVAGIIMVFLGGFITTIFVKATD